MGISAKISEAAKICLFRELARAGKDRNGSNPAAR